MKKSKEQDIELDIPEEVANPKSSDKKALQEVQRLSKEVEELKEETTKWKNKYYEAYADLDNTRKSLSRDHDVAMKYRAMGFLEKLLPALDSFEMAFKFKPTDEKIANYTKGFEMIYSQFEKAMADEGFTPINPAIGDEFDHNTMQAIGVEEGEVDNVIKSVYLKGYFLKDRIVRPAMVIVTKVKEEVKDETNEGK